MASQLPCAGKCQAGTERREEGAVPWRYNTSLGSETPRWSHKAEPGKTSLPPTRRQTFPRVPLLPGLSEVRALRMPAGWGAAPHTCLQHPQIPSDTLGSSHPPAGAARLYLILDSRVQAFMGLCGATHPSCPPHLMDPHPSIDICSYAGSEREGCASCWIVMPFTESFRNREKEKKKKKKKHLSSVSATAPAHLRTRPSPSCPA